MSVSSALCKLFRFLANTFELVVDTVAQGVKVLGSAAVDVLSDLASSVGDALGLDGSTVLWLGIGIVAFLLLRGGGGTSAPVFLEQRKEKERVVNGLLLTDSA